jgi:hypothetical protein
MNNVSSIDFAMRDWCDDSDLLLARSCMEFPRISNGYKSKGKDQARPWGDLSNPILFDDAID